jgi:hypothetical protein
MDGMTITALILWHLQPHHKVDMYSEISAIKKMTIEQYNIDINFFFNSIKSVKLQIDSKDPMEYTDDAFVHGIFIHLKNKMLPHHFKSKFTLLERRWQMDKEIVTSQSLMDDASTYYTNLVASGNWKSEVSKHAQIIALMTQISELKQAVSQVMASTNTFTPTPALSSPGPSKFEEWCLVKVDNMEEFNMIVKDGRNYYWCDQHKYTSSATQGMYVFHKPTEHEAWQAGKTTLNEQCRKGSKAKSTIPASVSIPKPSVTPSAAKLSLAKSHQEALSTTAGLTDDQFNKTWENCCNASGN